MTTDEFVAKWCNLNSNANLWLRSLRVEVTNGGGCGESYGRPDTKLEAAASVELTDIDSPEICEWVGERLGNAALDDLLPSLLDQLDQRLNGQVQWHRQLSSGNPDSAKPVLVVLAGAGFSKGFGLPITDELRDLALQVCPDPRPPGSDKEILQLDKYPLSEFSRVRSKITDIEYLLTIWVDYLDQLEQTKKRDVSSRDHYRDFIENLCCHLYARSKEAMTAHAGRIRAMTGWLQDAVEQYDVRFVTLNYDIILEQICRDAGLGSIYLLKAAGCASIPIRKLHGSLNWRRVLGSQAACADLEQLHQGGEKNLVAYRNLNEYWLGNSGEHPLIVPPSAGKKYDPIVLQTWRFAEHDLRIARKVLIVGYSFPPLDAFATVRLRDAIKWGTKEMVTYVSPSGDDCKRVATLLDLPDHDVLEARWDLDHFYAALD